VRPARTVTFSLSFLAAALTAVASAQTITSCVSKDNGSARIVSTAAACNPHKGTVVTWNAHGPAGPAGAPGAQGPTGATGPQGLPGLGLPHVLVVPAVNGDGVVPLTANGQALANAVASIKDSSASNPYVIQLDAGTFFLPSALTIPRFVSLKGAGMYSTLLEGYPLNFSSPASNGSNFSLSAVSINSTVTIDMAAISNILIDHVDIGGTDASLSIGSYYFNGSVLMTNSIVNSLTLANPYAATGVRFRLVGSEIDSLSTTGTIPADTLACIASYKADFALYTHTCH
jgi:hypothetical protein